ncbi:hypothetical protein AVEN_200334-1 [Araneus ventricosus]|uniref:Uncharacterized protein n=1 Tax=Araneus ventricosus TaxID=182803 RepID=A0A4Y2Q0U1_ARAVE|nr:hypothetical protein AVEN_200334-1 [Araneus ventricosus]
MNQQILFCRYDPQEFSSCEEQREQREIRMSGECRGYRSSSKCLQLETHKNIFATHGLCTTARGKCSCPFVMHRSTSFQFSAHPFGWVIQGRAVEYKCWTIGLRRGTRTWRRRCRRCDVTREQLVLFPPCPASRSSQCMD